MPQVQRGPGLEAVLNSRNETFHDVLSGISTGIGALGGITNTVNAISDRANQARLEGVQREDADYKTYTEPYLQQYQGDLNAALTQHPELQQRTLQHLYTQRTGDPHPPAFADHPAVANNPNAQQQAGLYQSDTPTLAESITHIFKGGDIADQRSNMPEQGFVPTDKYLDSIDPGWRDPNNPGASAYFKNLIGMVGPTLDPDRQKLVMSMVQGFTNPVSQAIIISKNPEAVGFKDAWNTAVDHAMNDENYTGQLFAAKRNADPNFAGTPETIRGLVDADLKARVMAAQRGEEYVPPGGEAIAPPTSANAPGQTEVTPGVAAPPGQTGDAAKQVAEQSKVSVTGPIIGQFAKDLATKPTTENGTKIQSDEVQVGKLAPGYQDIQNQVAQNPNSALAQRWKAAIPKAYDGANKIIAGMFTGNPAQQMQDAAKLQNLGISLQSINQADPKAISAAAQTLRGMGIGQQTPDDKAAVQNFLMLKEGVAHTNAVRATQSGNMGEQMFNSLPNAKDIYMPNMGGGGGQVKQQLPPTALTTSAPPVPKTDYGKDVFRDVDKIMRGAGDVTQLGNDNPTLQSAMRKTVMQHMLPDNPTKDQVQAQTLTADERAALNDSHLIMRNAVFKIDRNQPVTFNGVAMTTGQAMDGIKATTKSMEHAYNLVHRTGLETYDRNSTMNDPNSIDRLMADPQVRSLPQLMAQLDPLQKAKIQNNKDAQDLISTELRAKNENVLAGLREDEIKNTMVHQRNMEWLQTQEFQFKKDQANNPAAAAHVENLNAALNGVRQWGAQLSPSKQTSLLKDKQAVLSGPDGPEKMYVIAYMHAQGVANTLGPDYTKVVENAGKGVAYPAVTTSPDVAKNPLSSITPSATPAPASTPAPAQALSTSGKSVYDKYIH